MKIDLNSPAVSLTSVDLGSKKVSTGGLSAAQGTTEDRTTLRTDSSSVQTLTSQAMSSPQVRQDKVDALSLAVSKGEYKPDSAKTANAMVDSKSI
jgi:flagellar biosynthesis anti-sigma factor FlgM